MFRTRLADKAGMLFFYETPQEITMWMRNTYIPLDMVFIRADGIVHRIEARTEPLSENIVASRGDVTACLELAGGAAERLGLKPGDRVEHRFFKPAKTIAPPGNAPAAGVAGSSYPNERSTRLTTALLLRPPTISVRWSRSHTSSSISISVKSGARRTMRTLSMLPSDSPITCAIWASDPAR